MKSKLVVLSTLIVTILVVGMTVQAATVVKLSLSDMVMMSHRIVIGTITDVSSAYNEEHTQIFTTVTMDVSETLKGSASGTVAFKQVGGVVGDTRVSVPGFPVFKTGSEVLLFLNNDPSGHIPTVGLGQGKFNVYVDNETGEKMIANDVLGLKTFEARQLTEVSSMRMTLSDMKESILDILRTLHEQKK